MVTDRASTACLCIVLGALYPQYVAGLCSLIMLDLFSHWYHTSATRTGTHKKSSNWLVNVYYSRKVLFTVCAATELWYMSLYMMHFTPGPALPLPASWGNLVNLHDLDLEGNKLTGSIPTAWFPDQETCAANVGINGVHSISLAKNNLEGPLPDGMK